MKSFNILAIRYLQSSSQGGGGEDSSSEKSKGKGGPPPRWDDWLKATHDGGKERVPNPKSETRDRYPEVSFSTALKDKAFFQKALEEYKKWVSKNPPEDSEGKSEKEEKTPLMGDEKAIQEIMTKHGETFNRILKDMSSGVAAYEKDYKKPRGFYPNKEAKKTAEKLIKRFTELSPIEKALHVNGHKLGEYFQEHVLKDKETHEMIMDGWRASSSSDEALQLCGALSALGVPGSLSPDDKKEPSREENLKAGKANKRLQEYIQEVYNFTQAFFRHHGVKSLTLYRGVRGQGTDSLDEGEEVGVLTREASSFTSDPMKTAIFGRGIEFSVPVEQVFASSMTYPGIGTSREAGGIGESEVVVMGASTLKGKLITPKASKL